MSALSRIDAIRDKVRQFKEEAVEAKTSISQLNRAAERYLALVRRMGLPEPVLDALTRLQQLKIAFITLYRSAMLLQTATGFGFLTAIAGVILGGAMLVDQAMIENEMRGR